MKNSIVTKVTNRIHAKQAGWVFTPKDFLDLGTRSNIDFILHSLVQKKMIRNIGRGIYDFPINHSKLGMLSRLCCMNRDLDAITHCCKN